MNQWVVKMWGANLFLDEDGWFDLLDKERICTWHGTPHYNTDGETNTRRFKYWIMAFLFSFCGIMGRPVKELRENNGTVK